MISIDTKIDNKLGEYSARESKAFSSKCILKDLSN